jgi:N-acetyl-anhydromuramyl-L-alanine amidase AmpD
MIVIRINFVASPNVSKGRTGWKPDIIVNHITEGSFEGAVSWLCNRASGVSAHFVVARDGRITQLVSIEDTAWTNGTNNTTDNRGNQHSLLKSVRERGVNANLYTISIEYEGRLSETQGALAPAQLDAAIWLTNHIRNEVKRIYGQEIPINRENIVGHRDITPRWKPNCPGNKFPFDELISFLHALDGSVTEKNSFKVSNNHWARDAWIWGQRNAISDGSNPTEFATREQVMVMLFNFHRLVTAGGG